MFRQLFSAILVLIGAAPAAAGTSAVNGTVIDTAGYEGVAAIAHLGAVTSTGVPAIKLQQGDLADGSDMADITGSTVTGNDTMSSKLIGTEVHRPTKRYVRAVVTRTTANVVLNSVIIQLFGASLTPVTQTDLVEYGSIIGP